MRLLWLPDVLRAAGLQVVEVSGWRTRGSDSFNPRGIIVHATAGNRSATDQGELNVILRGSRTAPPPIAQLMLGRSGVWYVVASGRCNHALAGQRGTPLEGIGNSGLLGIEGCNDNRGEPWSNYDSYVHGVAAIVRRTGWPVIGHKEHQPSGKSDPTFNMHAFREAVRGAAPTPAPAPAPTARRKRPVILYHAAGSNPATYALAGISPGTPANWQETTDYSGLAVPWAQRFGDAITLSPGTWELYKSQFLAPLKVEHVE